MKKLDPRSFKVVPGRNYNTPKELWGFRSERGTGSAQTIAIDFLEANQETLGIETRTIVRKAPRVVRSLGATHVIFQQRWKSRRVHRAYVTVHVGEDRRVYLVKSRSAPPDVLKAAKEGTVDEASAVRAALRRVRGKGRAWIVGDPEPMWFPAKRNLHPVWKVRVHRTKPRAEFIVYVNAETRAIVQVYDNLAALTGQGRVFLPHPMALDKAFVPLDGEGNVRPPSAASYAEVAIAALKGNGYLDGMRASTSLTKNRLRRMDGDFRVNWNRKGFEEVSAYHHVDRAIAYLEGMGYTGARRIFTSPLEIDARGTPEDNSWYSPGERTLTFGLGDIDDAEDGETVLHEFGHALQDAICPDFGQSIEAAAMGEGFGDYWAASYFESAKQRPYRLTAMSWDGALLEGKPPCVRRLDSKHTYETFDHASSADEHANGEIWSATLWEVRKVLGREKADRTIVESHFQLDGFTTFARGARAILDADRNVNHGGNSLALRRVFRKRGIGPVE